MVVVIVSVSIFLFGWLTFDQNYSLISKLETEKNKKVLEIINQTFSSVAALKPSREEELLKWNTPKNP